MKKLYFISILFAVFNTNVYAQNVYKILKNYDTTLEKAITKDFKLVLISNSNCGHCIIALEKIKPFTTKTNIIVADYGDDEKRKELQSKYNYIFLNGNQISQLGIQDFFPILFLFNQKDQLIWREEGWFDLNSNTLKSKLTIN